MAGTKIIQLLVSMRELAEVSLGSLAADKLDVCQFSRGAGLVFLFCFADILSMSSCSRLFKNLKPKWLCCSSARLCAKNLASSWIYGPVRNCTVATPMFLISDKASARKT